MPKLEIYQPFVSILSKLGSILMFKQTTYKKSSRQFRTFWTAVNTSIIITIFSSCTVPYTITVHKDSSATVQTIGIFTSYLNRHYLSNIISHIDTSGPTFSFDIINIDSLGNYLPVVQNGFFKFHLDSNSLTVTDGYGTAFEENDCFCCHVNMLIKFEQDIKEVKSDNKVAKKKGKNSIQISKGRRQFKKGKRKVNLTVKF